MSFFKLIVTDEDVRLLYFFRIYLDISHAKADIFHEALKAFEVI